MERPVLLLRKRSARRLAKVDPSKNIPAVLKRLKAEGKYSASHVRSALRAA